MSELEDKVSADAKNAKKKIRNMIEIYSATVFEYDIFNRRSASNFDQFMVTQKY
jgi:hypothetical protein